MIKTMLCSAFLLGVTVVTNAQHKMEVYQENNVLTSLDIKDIKTIQFQSHSMIVKTNNNTKSFGLAGLQKVEFIQPNVANLFETEEALGFEVFPNPLTSNEAFSLNYSSIKNVKSVSIYTIDGLLIKTLNGEVNSVDMSAENQGTYIVAVHTGTQIITQKIIKL